MKIFVALIATCAAGLIWTAAHAQTAAKPVAGTEVGLEHDPSNEMVAKGTTDREGNVTFSNLKPGRYRVVLTDKSKLTVPTRVTISGTAAAPVVSEPIRGGPVRKQGLRPWEGRPLGLDGGRCAKPAIRRGGQCCPGDDQG